jgi:electron transport complex protein RnfE
VAEEKSNLKWEAEKGILRKNPIFVIMLGLCPFLAISKSVEDAVWMTLAFGFVLLGSCLIISLLRRWIPKNVRIPIFVVVISSFVTITELVIRAYSPTLREHLGIFLPLITVNCIVLGRVEAFSSKRPVLESLADAGGMTAGFGLAIVSISIIRELLGSGGISLFGHSFVLLSQPASGFLLSPGGFLVMGGMLALLKKLGVI